MRTCYFLILLVLLATACPAQNLYPDPGFERSGRQGEARSGTRAGHLAVSDKTHWVALGGAFPVEPFATYRASAWVKGRLQEGSILALYAYQWDSYVWAFIAQQEVGNAEEWQPVSVTFRVPTDHVFFHPLALLDAAHGEAWIDDLALERVQTAEETIAELERKQDLTDDETRLLGRWHVQQGDLKAAADLMQAGRSSGVNADLACVIAKAIPEPRQRLPFLVDMIRYGAAGLNDGMRRIGEVSAGLEQGQVVDAVLAAVRDGRGGPQAIAGLATYLRLQLRLPTRPVTVAEQRQRLSTVAAEVESMLGKLPPGAIERAEVERLRDEVRAQQEAMEKEMKQLGHCILVIGGETVRSDTHQLVIPDSPTPQEELAARDLQAHLEKITGQVIPLGRQADGNDRRWIVVGRSALIGELGVAVDYDALGADGIRIQTVGPHLILAGNRRGVLYAVYTFLEDQIGCRWFTPDCMTWPTEGRIEVGDLDLTYVPPLEYRATDYPNSRPAVFAVRNKLNGTQIEASEEWGGKISYKGFVHTFNALVPPDQYFDTHPEYFSEINGQRVRDYTQLCLTNPDVLRIAIETVRRWIAESPEATIISVSQNDWHNYCTCARCSALAEQEGAQSGPLLHFVNAIADDIARDYPHIIIDTLAYQYTRKPPLHVRPRPNVAVRLCSIECEFNRPLETSPFNASFVDDIRGWNAICDRLHIWDYVINYAHCVQPFPNLRVLQPNIQFFIRNGVTGIYEEANYFSRGGEFAELRTYLMAKLLWDPYTDVERHLSEFLAAYYGAAAPFLRQYIDSIHDLAVVDDNFHMRIYVPPTAPFQRPGQVEEYERLFDEAEAAVADDEVRLHRVQVARLPILYTRIAQQGQPVYQLTEDALVPAAGLRELVDRFETIARKEGLTAVSEDWRWGALDTWLGQVRARSQTYGILRLRGGGLEAVVVPGLGGRILSLKHRDRELMQVVAREGGLDPTTGGYEEFSESGYRSPGWHEPFQVVKQTQNSVNLATRLPNGLQLERSYRLDPDAPILQVVSTLTNPGDAPRTACLRVHPCFRLEDAGQARLRVGAEEHDLSEGTATEKELWLRGERKPAGEWTLVDAVTGVTLVSRFRPEQVGTCYLNWNGPDQRVNLELWSPERALQPGENLTLEHEYLIER